MLLPDGKTDGISLEASLNFSFVRGGATFATPGMGLAWCLHETDTHCFLLPVCSLEQHHSFIHSPSFSQDSPEKQNHMCMFMCIYIYIYIYIYICLFLCVWISMSFFLSFLSSYLKIFILRNWLT